MILRSAKMKNYYKTIIIPLAVAMTASCSSFPKFQKNENVAMTFQSGESWSKEIQATAKDTYLYAQMASNSYKGNRPYYALPEYIQLLEEDSQDNDDFGLAFNVYRITRSNEKELVVAFRGSEDTRDWKEGNLLKKQLSPALEKFEALMQKYPDHTFSVTGDSLGGSLATQVSLCHKVKISVSLNSSPRFSSKKCINSEVILGPNNRHSITEYGEAAKVLRLFGREATQLYTSINCRGGNTFEQHNVFDLALCLTKIAAQVSDNAKLSYKSIEYSFRDED